LTDAQLVAHVRYTRHRIGDVFRAAFLFATLHAPGERDHAVVDDHLDVCRIDISVIRQTVVYIFADALVGSLLTARPAARVHSSARFIWAAGALDLFIDEPRPELAACAFEESPLLGVAAAVIWLAVFVFIAPVVIPIVIRMIIGFARAFAIFMATVIVSAVRLAVIPAAVTAPGRFGGIRSAALAATTVTGPLAAIAAAPRFFITAALASAMRLVLILSFIAVTPVMIIVVVRHLALIHKG
jgi:hypothetical protein